MDVSHIAIGRAIPYARNPRRNDTAVAKVAASIREFGWRQPIVVDKDMVVVVGHTRPLAASPRQPTPSSRVEALQQGTAPGSHAWAVSSPTGPRPETRPGCVMHASAPARQRSDCC